MATQNSAKLDPYLEFNKHYAKTLQLDTTNPNWMAVATLGEEAPNIRVVLLKHFSAEDGFVFFTNYNSQKAQEIFNNPNVSLLFFWDQLALQIKIKGVAEKTSRQASISYFAKRNRASQIGAWASYQSQILKSRSELTKRVTQMEEKFSSQAVPCPPNWGGIKVVPHYFEFWFGSSSDRLHTRVCYSKQADGWKSYSLYP